MQSSEQGTQGNDHIIQGEQLNIQVGMALLPDTIDFDLGFEPFQGHADMILKTSSQRADGVRLWTKHFAPIGHMNGIHILDTWVDFFTIVLLNP
jgi:hypothetical protein